MNTSSSIRSRSVSQNHAISALGVTLLMGALVGLGGCGASGPQVSGFALAHTRFVNTGDVVTLRSPLTQNGERQWRVLPYNSNHLEMLGQPRVARKSDGTGEIVLKAKAKEPGLTKVVFVEDNPPIGNKARRVRFRIRIFR